MAKKKGDTENSPDGLGTFMSAYDWQEAMVYARENFDFKDIEKIIFEKEGEPDGRDWLLIVLLKNGKYGWLHAGCDYSGWDCQAGGESGIVETEEEAFRILKKVYEDQGYEWENK